jgi:hypothetical protein
VRKFCRKIPVNLIILLCICSSIYAHTDSLYINEILAANINSNLSPTYSEYADWIELYNADTSEADIGGYYLTDNPFEPAKWEIPANTKISAGGYILFWADNHDTTIHTNFELSRRGEFIGLFDAGGSVIDSFRFSSQKNDISYGRMVNDLNSWGYFDTVTPGSPNNIVYYSGIAADPQFSVSGGYYSGSQTLTLSSEIPATEIHYTFDGRPPVESSPLYSESIGIDSTMVIRIRTYEDGKLPGDIITHTYFIDEEVNLPFISLVTDPDNLFDDVTGIYVIGTNGVSGYCSSTPMNVNQDWERCLNIEYYDMNGDVQINQRAGVKIFGGCSRTRYPQKSLALYARSEYGKGSFDYQLFTNKPIYSFESFVLRSSADDSPFTMYRDPLAQSVLTGEVDADGQAYVPAVVFINGEYWGIHNIREQLNEHYVVGNYNIYVEEVNLLKRYPEMPYNVVYGSAEHYNDMIDYIDAHNMATDVNYEYIKTQMNVDSYIDYQIAEIFLGADDWPGNNIKFWRATTGPFNKWKWMFYDMDWTFTHSSWNILERATDPNCNCGWPNPPWSTFLFRKLLENESFKNEFIQRYAYYISTTFHPDRLKYFIDSLKTNIEPEIPRHLERWGDQTVPNPESWIKPNFNSMEEWEYNINVMRTFTDERPAYAISHLTDYFDLTGMANLTIGSNLPDAGIMKINNKKIPGGEYQGDYFRDIPLNIKAISFPGYKFSYWEAEPVKEEPITYTTSEIEIELTSKLVLTAYFEEAVVDTPVVIINEINYHSPDSVNPGDWIELYNRRDETIDLTGWTFKDENDEHIFVFPNGLEIGTNDYLVLCNDITSFETVFPGVKNSVGNFNFGLSNGGEVIRLYDLYNSLIDSVHYDDTEPWPVSPDGTGPTLELKGPDLNNDSAQNWTAHTKNGTPGAQNLVYTPSGLQDKYVSLRSVKHALYQNYPNPFDLYTNISYSITKNGFVRLRVYDISGREILNLVNEYQQKGTYTVKLNAGNLKSGIYFYTLQVNNEFATTRRMVIVR